MGFAVWESIQTTSLPVPASLPARASGFSLAELGCEGGCDEIAQGCAHTSCWTREAASLGHPGHEERSAG